MPNPSTYPYRRFPTIQAGAADHAARGTDAVKQELHALCAGSSKTVVTVECYPGTDQAEILALFPHAELIIHADDLAIQPAELDAKIEHELTDDPVFGIMTTWQMKNFYPEEALCAARGKIDAVTDGLVLVYGVGASLVERADITIYADITRWEIQLRFRKGQDNWHTAMHDLPQRAKYKRGYFAEWRWGDRIKDKLLPVFDYYLDTTSAGDPAIVPGAAYREALSKAAAQPFRMVPYTCQVSPHPRGRKISFIDTLSYGEEKEYTYAARHKAPETLNTRHCYMGAEEVRDIVNDYDPVTYRLPYEVENKFFRICYKPGDGITSFVDKRTGTEMAGTAIPFFTPVYQRTPLHQEVPFSSYEERRALGRNIRGKHAETHIGKLMEITCMEHGPVFTQLRLHYSLAGTVKADVLLKLYEAIPRIDFTLELGKTISDEVESVFLSLDLNRLGNETVLRKGAREAFRPGIDQLPGTCMEFYMSDDGAARLSPEGSVLIAARDVPMFYTGEMQHHPIRLCDGAAENNARPLYSWVMNNNWETNFKMDLSGFCQYDYSLWLTNISDPEQAMDELHEQLFDPYVLIVR